jgi:hypothetical protein
MSASSSSSTHPEELQGSPLDDVADETIVIADVDDTSDPSILLLDPIVDISNIL